MQTIQVTLSRTRTFPGSLRLWTTDVPPFQPTKETKWDVGLGTLIFGPVPCLGKADSYAAAQHGNASRDPLREFGDTPTGAYACTLEPAASGPDALRSYGPHARILLTPTGGAALEAARQRSGLMIHGGAPGDHGGLRPTHGCLRLSNDNMAALLAVFKEPCQLTLSELSTTSSAAPTGNPSGDNATTVQS